jgi:uroporphyrinogen-III synthase
LSGWCVVVTRARAQSTGLVRRLEEAGAETVEVPVIEIAEPFDEGVALREALFHLPDYDWLVLTSTNAVERCGRLLGAAWQLGEVKVAAVGVATARALGQRHVVVDLIPERYLAEALLEAFPAPSDPGSSSVLLPCAAGARDLLAVGLADKGWKVDVVEAYRTIRPAPGETVLEAAGRGDVITFTSSSTVSGYLELVGRALLPPVVACIGPVTAATALEAGIAVDILAPVHTVDGLVAALVAWAADRVVPGERQ